MGIRKSNITPSINVDDMLKSAEISHEIEAEKQDVDKLLVEIREAKETLLKIQQDLQNVIKAEDDVTVALKAAIDTWKTMLENHCSKQAKMLTEHEFNMRKILRRNEGIWFSDFWMKVLGIFLFVYTVTLVLVAYCVT